MYNVNLKEMGTEALHAFIEEIRAELKSREESLRLVVYTHDCKGRAKYHMNKYKHWCKLIKEIDSTKADGYAFIGDFLNVGSENMVEAGSIVVEVCGTDYTAYRIINDYEKEKIADGSRGSLRGMITTIAEVLGK